MALASRAQLPDATESPGAPLAKEASARSGDSTTTYGSATSATHPAASGVKLRQRAGYAGPAPELPRDLGDFEAMTAEELIAWAHQFFWPRVCLTCSWQKQSSVLVHMVADMGLRMDTVELDTHLFFRESYETRDRLVDKYALKLIQPSIPTIAEQHRAEGANLWERDPDRCCHIRKVEPLVNALAPYDAWISGIRRDQSPSRAGTPKVEWSERFGVFKIHPLADWDEKRVWSYIEVNEIPYNPLHDAGYRSIGCIPCTRPTGPEDEERAGRWAGSDKLECGIHADTTLKGRHESAHLRA